MTMQSLTENAAAPVATVGGASGLLNLGLSFWQAAIGVGQFVLLVLSIFSVFVGLYIAWPKFIGAWRDNGGWRAFWRGTKAKRRVSKDD